MEENATNLLVRQSGRESYHWPITIKGNRRSNGQDQIEFKNNKR